jgi:hypothetical protein
MQEAGHAAALVERLRRTLQDLKAQVPHGPNGKTHDTRSIAGFLAIALVIVAAAWFSLKKDTSDVSPAPVADPTPTASDVTQGLPGTRPALSVIGYDWARNAHGGLALVGTVKNSSSKPYSYVQVEFDLYDKSGARIGSTFSNVNNLEPNGTWTFEALIHEEENVTDAKLKAVTGF